jgi:thioredoxin-dependent peroxiredoxin
LFGSEEERMLQAGDEAPDFSLASDEGETVTLSALRGRPVVFYFYPKDDTPGCTAQACSLRDGYGEIAASGAALYGISPDDAGSHRAFRAKFALPFPLLVDEGHAVADAYGAWGERPDGRVGMIRSSFVVGADGRILRASYDVKPEDTTPEALAALSA